jgi:hypothetical protein
MTWRRLLGTWLLLAVLMPVNGALREFGFKRIMGDETAEVLSVVTGILVILGTTFALFRIPRDAATGRLAAQSAALVALTVCYEFAIGLRGGQSLSALLGHYAFWRGELWPLVLVALAATPFLWRGRR